MLQIIRVSKTQPNWKQSCVNIGIADWLDFLSLTPKYEKHQASYKPF